MRQILHDGWIWNNPNSAWVLATFLIITLCLPPKIQFYTNSVLTAMIVVLSLLWIGRLWLQHSINRTEQAGILLTLLWSVWILVTLACHQFLSNRPIEWLTLLIAAAFFGAGYFCNTGSGGVIASRYLSVLMGLSAIEAMIALFQAYWPSILPPALIYEDGIRAAGSFTNPNQFGGFLSAVIPVACFFLFAEARRVKWRRTFWAWILVPLLLVALRNSDSRGASLALFAGLSLMVLIFVIARRKWFLTGIVCLLLIGSLFLAGWLIEPYLKSQWGDHTEKSPNPTLQDRVTIPEALTMRTRTSQVRMDTSILDRLSALRGCYQMWRDHPWFGVGPGNFTLHSMGYIHGVQDFVFYQTGAHNLPFQWLAEMGLVGGLAWPAAGCLFVVILYRRFHRKPHSSRETRAAFCLGWAFFAVWTHNWVDITVLYHPLKNIFPFLAALAVNWPPAEGEDSGSFNADE